MLAKLDSTWFLNIKSHPESRATLICFPHGGGSASVFWPWQAIPLELDIWALKLPGRDKRIAETPITSPTELVNLILEALPKSFSKPFIFYGHSMGAGIAFELILELQKQKRRLPSLYIASGREPPHYKYRHSVNNLDDDELIHYVKSLGSAPDNLPTNTDFLKLYLPKIRADYILNANIPQRNPITLPIPIAIINGKEDRLLEMKNLQDWSLYSSYPVHSSFLSGNHFFIENNFSEFSTVFCQLCCTIL